MVTSFVGGEWSEVAQGRMTDPRYKTGMSRAQNSFFLESGAWTRRPGFRFLQYTYLGEKGRLAAFDFEFDTPYQAILTDNRMQFIQGFLPVTDTSTTTYIDTIDTNTPARVYVTDTLAAGFVDGDIIVIITDNHFLTGRTFLIDNVGTNFFDLFDPVTGDPIDGTDVAYVPPLVTPDTLFRLQTLATPWDVTEIDDVRWVQRPEDVLFLHAAHPPQVLTLTNGIFSLDPAVFLDGPYYDENTTTTTLTPSGNGPTGITLTASSIVGINDDTGFQTTDIGRLIRLRVPFLVWSSGSTYANGQKVEASDGNTYQSQKGGNLNHDPTTDDGEWWAITADDQRWTYYEVVAPYVSTTVVNVERQGDPVGIRATTHWRLGLFSNTTGFPSVGVYHEGRLWLSGVKPNRLDASKSNDPYNFEPTAADGSIADNSAVAIEFNAKELNDIVWLLSTEGGLIAGSPGGEWRVRASTLDDPISPTSIQARRVSTFGCAFVDPVEAYGVAWVQTRQRKILGTGAVGDDRFTTDNLTINADHVTGTGIVELRWMQEPCLNLWARRADQGLWSAAYRKNGTNAEDDYVGWAETVHGMGRVFESISVGPSYDGLANALYVVTNQLDDTKPDFNVRWVEVIMPVLDSGREDFAAWFVDGGCQPSYVVLNEAGDEITVGGLWHLEGYSIQPFSGGLDLGDYTVTNGEITITLEGDPEGKFTESFLLGLTNGTDYGPFTWTVPQVTSTPVPPVVAALTFSVPNIVERTNGNEFFLDRPNETIVLTNQTADTITICEGDTGNLLNTVTCAEDIITPNIYLERQEYIVNMRDSSNSARIGLFDPVTGLLVSSYGIANSSTATSVGGRILHASQYLQVQVDDGETFLVSNGITSVSSANEIAILVPSQFSLYPGIDALKEVDTFVGRTYLKMARGFEREERSSFYVITFDGSNDEGSAATVFDIWEYYVGGIAITRRQVTSFVPTDIDPLWTTAVSPRLMADPTDGTLVMTIQRNSGTGNAHYMIKMDIAGNIIWQVTTPISMFIDGDTRLHSARWDYLESTGGDSNVYNFDLNTGAYVQHDYTCRISPSSRKQIWDDVSASITVSAASAESNLNLCFTLLGTWAVANNGLNDTNKSCRLFLGADTDFPDNVIQDEDVTNLYVVPACFGVTFVSRGQLLRPDYGQDSGAQAGPAFAKKRRLHWWAGAFVRAQKTYVGTDFDKMYPIRFQTQSTIDVGTPTYFDGTVTTTVNNDYTWNGKIAWQITRPFPCTISAIAGFIETQDK